MCHFQRQVDRWCNQPMNSKSSPINRSRDSSGLPIITKSRSKLVLGGRNVCRPLVQPDAFIKRTFYAEKQDASLWKNQLVKPQPSVLATRHKHPGLKLIYIILLLVFSSSFILSLWTFNRKQKHEPKEENIFPIIIKRKCSTNQGEWVEGGG